MPNALEVSIDGKVVGIYVPPAGKCFSAMLANIPKTYMRAQVISGSDNEDWYWQLPDIEEGQIISFRMIHATQDEGVPPERVVPRNRDEYEKLHKLAKEKSTKRNKRR